MIQFQQKPTRAETTAIAAASAVSSCLDAGEAMSATLQRLVDLIDDKLPAARVAADWTGAQKDAALIIAHLQEFEGARYTHREVGGGLYGLRMAGASTSSAAGPVVLLRNWQSEARQWIEALA